MAHELGLHHRGRRVVPKILNNLKRRGVVEEVSGGRFRLAEGHAPRAAAKKLPRQLRACETGESGSIAQAATRS